MIESKFVRKARPVFASSPFPQTSKLAISTHPVAT